MPALLYIYSKKIIVNSTFQFRLHCLMHFYLCKKPIYI